MKRNIAVFIGEHAQALGELRYNWQGHREHAAFAYSAEWLADSHGPNGSSGPNEKKAFAIDPALPLVAGFQFHAGSAHTSIFHSAIADSEPDGWARRVILRDYAKRREITRAQGQKISTDVLGALGYLLAVDDESRIGALRFCDEDGIFQGSAHADDGSERRTPSFIDLRQLLASSQAVEMSTETAQDLAYLRGRGTSLGGLRPKCTIRDEDGHLAIGKFPSVSDERAVTKAEILALHLARTAGIHAAEGRIVMSDDIPVAVIRRFDRTKDGARIPYLSAASMLGVERDSPVESTYTDIVDAIRIHGAHAQSDIEELFRRIAFSICINNVDDHLHNHGFLHVAHGQWRLAPAFDINPFPDRIRELKTWISHESGPAASLDALRASAPYFRINPQHAETIIGEVCNAVSQWQNAGAKIGMTQQELKSFTEAFRLE